MLAGAVAPDRVCCFPYCLLLLAVFGAKAPRTAPQPEHTAGFWNAVAVKRCMRNLRPIANRHPAISALTTSLCGRGIPHAGCRHMFTPLAGCPKRLPALIAYHTHSSLSRLNFAKCPIAFPSTITQQNLVFILLRWRRKCCFFASLLPPTLYISLLYAIRIVAKVILPLQLFALFHILDRYTLPATKYWFCCV